MRLFMAALTGVGLAALAASDVCAQPKPIFVTAGGGWGCRGSDGSVCSNDSSTLVSTVGVHATELFAITFRTSRLDDASGGDTVYYSGQPSVESARLRSESGRTVRYGAEFLFHPPARAGQALSAFVGGSAGVRTRVGRTTCVSGDCLTDSRYLMLIGNRRHWSRTAGFVGGVELVIARSVIARGTLRLDDFPGELGATHLTIELGYRFGKRPPRGH